MFFQIFFSAGTLQSAGIGTAVQTLPQVPVHRGWIPHDATAAAQPWWLHERFAEWRNCGVARLLVTTGALQATRFTRCSSHSVDFRRFVQGILQIQIRSGWKVHNVHNVHSNCVNEVHFFFCIQVTFWSLNG